MLDDRGVVSRQRRGRGELSAGPADQRRRDARPGRGALRGAADAAGQDPVRHARRAAAPDGEAAFALDCAAAQAADLAKRLGFYKLRAKVAIADESADRGVARLLGRRAGERAGRLRLRRPARRRASAGARSCRAPRRPRSAGHVNEYEALRIARRRAARAASISPMATPSRTTPTSTCLHGVDFDKGCYVGQEVVSRMKHRGTARKRVVRVKLAGPAPAPGTPVLDGELAVGALGSSSGREALALLRLDRVEEAAAAGADLSAGGVGGRARRVIRRAIRPRSGLNPWRELGRSRASRPHPNLWTTRKHLTCRGRRLECSKSSIKSSAARIPTHSEEGRPSKGGGAYAWRFHGHRNL